MKKDRYIIYVKDEYKGIIERIKQEYPSFSDFLCKSAVQQYKREKLQ